MHCCGPVGQGESGDIEWRRRQARYLHQFYGESAFQRGRRGDNKVVVMGMMGDLVGGRGSASFGSIPYVPMFWAV